MPADAAIARGTALSAAGFDGLSAAWKYFVGRPDQSLAAGPNGILQMINGGFVALYDRKGRLYRGWPKDAALFFGLPKGSPMVDHRAIYDAWSKRYWLSSGNQGHPLIYVAVSQTANPNGKWNVYGFNVEPSRRQLWDFDMFGLDRNTVSLSTDLDTISGTRVVGYSNAVYTVPKAPMEGGASNVTGHGFTNIVVDGLPPLAVQPIIVNPYAGTPPPGEMFLATPDTRSCDGAHATGCREMYAFLVAGNKLTMTRVATPPIAQSPLADTPACSRCLETVGIFMPSGGVYYRGLVYFAFGVGIPSYETGSAGIFWGELRPRFSASTLRSASLVQHGTIAFGGHQAAFLPSVMSDAKGNFYLLFDSSGPTLNPSIYVAVRRPNDRPGAMTSIRLLKRGLSAPPTHWFGYAWFPYGDYTTSSFDPNTGVWFSSEYAQSAGTYGTYIANVRL